MKLVEKLKKHWKWLVPTVLILSALIIVPLIINQEKEAIKEASNEFHSEPLKSESDFEGYSIFLPQGYIIENKDGFNLTIKKGNQKYLIFINSLEDRGSQLLYNELNHQQKKYVINQLFNDGEKFGYILADKNNQTYGLTIGVGGYKISTSTNRSNLATDAKDMMRIVNSIEKLQ